MRCGLRTAGRDGSPCIDRSRRASPAREGRPAPDALEPAGVKPAARRAEAPSANEGNGEAHGADCEAPSANGGNGGRDMPEWLERVVETVGLPVLQPPVLNEVHQAEHEADDHAADSEDEKRGMQHPPAMQRGGGRQSQRFCVPRRSFDQLPRTYRYDRGAQRGRARPPRKPNAFQIPAADQARCASQ